MSLPLPDFGIFSKIDEASLYLTHDLSPGTEILR